MNNKSLLNIISLIAIGLFISSANGFSQTLSKDKLGRAMELYHYSQWEAGTTDSISGIKMSNIIDDTVRTQGMKKVWNQDKYSVEKNNEVSYSIIRQWWKSTGNDDGQLDIAMIVCPTYESAKRFLITRYANTSLGTVPGRIPGHSMGVHMGNVCFISKAKQDGQLSTIDFIQNNVILMMRAEGRIKKDLQVIAGELERQLLNNTPVGKYSLLTDIPTILHFSSDRHQIKYGESEPLQVDLKSPQNQPVHYMWEMSGGGIDIDRDGNFSYYGGEIGKQVITLTVVNELGLHYSKSIEIEVVK